MCFCVFVWKCVRMFLYVPSFRSTTNGGIHNRQIIIKMMHIIWIPISCALLLSHTRPPPKRPYVGVCVLLFVERSSLENI